MGQDLGYNGEVTLSCKCRDRKKSIDWYTRVLGFELLYDVAEIGWCEMRTPVDKMNIGFSEVEDVQTGGPVPTFGVADIDAARKRLESQGVRFDGDTVTIPGMVKLATFFDPDGNALMFVQSLQ
ncbi:MAG: VOC family protein [Phycisphaeraceae bacterium]|nr:VOC family protein [Phycisphaeraceae bacterium]